MLHGRTAARRAHLRSHSGFNAGAALAHCPTAPEYTLPNLFRTLLLERLQLPLQVTEARCEGCHALLDTLGRHRASCTRSGRAKKRSTPIERALGRIFREAGASVLQNVFKKDMNVQVAAEDARRIEVLAQDLPCCGGVQLAIDVTLRRVLTAQGEAHPHAADWTRRKTHIQNFCILEDASLCWPGRWSAEAVQVLRQLSRAKAHEVPSFMRVPVALMWERRWTRLLAVARATSFAASLVDPASHVTWCHTGGEAPPLADLFEADPR